MLESIDGGAGSVSWVRDSRLMWSHTNPDAEDQDLVLEDAGYSYSLLGRARQQAPSSIQQC